MTKKLVAFLCFASVVVMLLGCSVSDTRYGEETDWSGIVGSRPLIMRTEFDRYPADVEYIRLIWENPTDENWSIGMAEGEFVLERLLNNTWRRVIFFEGSFTYGLDGVPANGTTWQDIPISRSFFPTLSAGTYRIIKDNVISNTFTLTN